MARLAPFTEYLGNLRLSIFLKIPNAAQEAEQSAFTRTMLYFQILAFISVKFPSAEILESARSEMKAVRTAPSVASLDFTEGANC